MEDTTIQDELTLSSELSFGPYAEAVDMIRTSAAFLCVDNDNRYIERKADSNVYEFMMETEGNLTNILMASKEDLVSVPLLWTALKDLPCQ